ncbi:MAG: valine--tRNA ligase [Bdellovibrionota bacterium]
MEKAYTPEIHDAKWQKFWDTKEIEKPEVSHAAHPEPSPESFVVMMPPPNVTGVLHQGHALMLTLEDTLVRWERMRGKKTLYLPGTDHASIAVQMQVVKHLASQGIEYKSLGREKFLEECWKWIEEYRPRIYGQVKAMGVSCDWSRVKFTMDEDLNKAVKRAFVDFYKKGHVYRAQKLINWCPKSLTVLSDLEVIFEEREGKLWHIKYPLVENPSEGLVVATTRPETLLGDVAVAVHPDDERYKKWIGKKLLLPFTKREIPIIADSFVEKDFGSGVVKITPAHDFTDFDVGTRHKLELINIFTPDAKIVKGLPQEAAQFADMDRFVARKKIVQLLQDSGHLVKEEAYKTRIGISERGGVPVEPYLSYQWFCKMDSMAQAVSNDLDKGDFKFVPHEFHNQFKRWMEGIRDWCISRQLWWGHAIPAFHCQDCQHVEVTESDLEECPKCKSKNLKPDPDVLDTWFSSGLWPFSTLGWPEKTSDMKEFYPTQVLETGFDILFFWVARMLMMGKELTGQLPFTRIYMHPLVRDEDGQKMSKSKGNTIDPLEIMKTVGADSLRMTLNALCVQGRDLRLSEDRIDTYRNFINKVWNATKFVLMDESVKEIKKVEPFDLPSRWILEGLDNCAFRVNKAWEEFRMQEAAEDVYHFVWNDFCDWFLEISKTDRKKYQPVLLFVLSETLKLMHPLCPHVTEELWHALPGVSADDSLSLQCFPKGKASGELRDFEVLKKFIVELRAVRNESKTPLSKVVNLYVPELTAQEKSLFETNALWIQSLGKGAVHLSEDFSGPSRLLTTSSIQAGATLSFKVPAAELVDVKEEKDRIKKELAQLNGYIGGLKSKLGNESFVARAPEQVVNTEKAKLKEAEEKFQKLNENLKQLDTL